MKKLIALALGIVLLTGCSAAPASSSGGVKTGLGHTVSIASSANATADKAGSAQVDAVMAAVTFDSAGKILAVKIDNAQVKVEFDAQGKIKTDLKQNPKTKIELGKDYGLAKQSKIGKEWYEQIAELEKWMVGKTVDQVKSMKVKKVDDAHTNVPDEADLKTKVTITVESYIAAVEDAFKNAK